MGGIRTPKSSISKKYFQNTSISVLSYYKRLARTTKKINYKRKIKSTTKRNSRVAKRRGQVRRISLGKFIGLLLILSKLNPGPKTLYVECGQFFDKL